MDRQYPALELQRLKHPRVDRSRPQFRFSKRDLLWLIVVAGMTTAWTADRSRPQQRPNADSPALAAAQAAAEHARRQETMLNWQLCGVRESLAAQRQTDAETIAKLNREIAALRAGLPHGHNPQLVIGRER